MPSAPVGLGSLSRGGEGVDAVVTTTKTPLQGLIREAFAQNAIISWYRGEFAAANAIIDALCSHLANLDGTNSGVVGSGYESVFAAIHRRRLNWIPILQMQKYHSIAEVPIELKNVAAKKSENVKVKIDLHDDDVDDANMIIGNEEVKRIDEKSTKVYEIDAVEEEDSPDSEITDGGSLETQTTTEHIEICSNHEQCNTRSSSIKIIKGFVAKEPVKGRMMNVVRGLKVYEDVFTDAEFAKLSDFVSELRVAGQNGKLSGETFKNFNQQIKGNKRELIQFGVPVFGQIKGEVPSKQEKHYIEPIPSLLQNVIDHLNQWCLISNKKPNSCIINFFDEGEYSQPYLKPPHLDQPIVTLVLSESTMAFGCTLVSDNDGNYKAPQMLSLKKGSLIVMRGSSADTAAHAMCPSPTKRASITFFRVRQDTNQNHSHTISPQDNTSLTLWQPAAIPAPYPIPNGALMNGDETISMIPKWGMIRAPMIMLAPLLPVPPIISSTKRFDRGNTGTGVFLPWTTVTPKRHTKHLPPRAQKGRLLSLLSPMKTNAAPPASTASETASDSGISVA